MDRTLRSRTHPSKIAKDGAASLKSFKGCASLPSVTGSNGKPRYPLAAEWADKNTKIDNWRVLGKGEVPQPGDVAAYKLAEARPIAGTPGLSRWSTGTGSFT